MTDPSLEVKLGQMILVGFRGATADQCADFLGRLRRYHVGCVWLTDNKSPMGTTIGNVKSPGQLRQLVADLQQAATIPLLVAVDGEGGSVIRLKEEFGFPRFPSPAELGERNDPKLTRDHAALLANTLRDCGINWNLAPVVDLNRNPDNPIIGIRQRSFGHSADTVLRHATAFIEAHHARDILCALKHFPGHGSSSADSHIGMVDVSQSWTEEELIPYTRLIQDRLADSVLPGHIMLRHLDPAHPATLSRPILDGLLRRTMGFDGVILSDDLNMRAVRNHYSLAETVVLCLNAGVDIMLHGNVDHYNENIIDETIAILKQQLASGRLTEERVDKSYQRIQTLTRRAKLI